VLDLAHHLHTVFGHVFLGALVFVWWSFDKNDAPNECRQKILGKAVPFYLSIFTIMIVSGLYMAYSGFIVSFSKLILIGIFIALFSWALSFHYFYKKLPINALLIRKGLILSLIAMIIIGHI
jgi:hypothetical protein